MSSRSSPCSLSYPQCLSSILGSREFGVVLSETLSQIASHPPFRSRERRQTSKVPESSLVATSSLALLSTTSHHERFDDT